VKWEGEDCSYITAYAAASRTLSLHSIPMGFAFTLVTTVIVLLFSQQLHMPAAVNG
jgi:hypothetical protein